MKSGIVKRIDAGVWHICVIAALATDLALLLFIYYIYVHPRAHTRAHDTYK